MRPFDKRSQQPAQSTVGDAQAKPRIDARFVFGGIINRARQRVLPQIGGFGFAVYGAQFHRQAGLMQAGLIADLRIHAPFIVFAIDSPGAMQAQLAAELPGRAEITPAEIGLDAGAGFAVAVFVAQAQVNTTDSSARR